MTAKDRVVIWGASGHALVVADAIRLEKRYEIVGWIDDVNPERKGEIFDGLGVVGGRESLPVLLEQGVDHLIVGIGDCSARLRLGREAQQQGFQLLTAIHPSAVLASSATIGKGSLLGANAVVNPATRIGEAVIVNTSASVDHECRVGDGVHIGPGVRLAGHVSIGQETVIGIGSAVKDRVSIGARCIIGAGSVVIDHLPDGVVAYGVPAKVVGKHQT